MVCIQLFATALPSINGNVIENANVDVIQNYEFVPGEFIVKLVMEKENKDLRELLWLRHGCSFPALYGDDGEMQCHHCMIDFKRDNVKKISQAFAK